MDPFYLCSLLLCCISLIWAYPTSNVQDFSSNKTNQELFEEAIKAAKIDLRIDPQGRTDTSVSAPTNSDCTVRAVPAAVRNRLRLSTFYKQYAHAYGIPVVSSSRVRRAALKRACYVMRFLFADRKDIRDWFYRRNGRAGIMAESEGTTTIPEHSFLPAWWNQRARGLGATIQIPISTGGEENLLCLPRDRYRNEDIFLHEFVHGIHNLGATGAIPDFDRRLRAAYNSARSRGLWRSTYALSTDREYFAEGAQSFFNVNDYSARPNGIHNHVNTREKLRGYDPTLYNLVKEVFPCENNFLKRCDAKNGKQAPAFKMDCGKDGGGTVGTDRPPTPPVPTPPLPTPPIPTPPKPDTPPVPTPPKPNTPPVPTPPKPNTPPKPDTPPVPTPPKPNTPPVPTPPKPNTPPRPDTPPVPTPPKPDTPPVPTPPKPNTPPVPTPPKPDTPPVPTPPKSNTPPVPTPPKPNTPPVPTPPKPNTPPVPTPPMPNTPPKPDTPPVPTPPMPNTPPKPDTPPVPTPPKPNTPPVPTPPKPNTPPLPTPPKPDTPPVPTPPIPNTPPPPKPNTPSPKPKPTKPLCYGTYDQHRHCRSWAKNGECTRNRPYMLLACCPSCRRHGTSVVTTRPCHDYNRSCQSWTRQGYCRRNPRYMLRYCCRSCRGHGTGVVTRRRCYDYNRSCQSWARQGECRRNPRYMLRNCRRSCNYCR